MCQPELSLLPLGLLLFLTLCLILFLLSELPFGMSKVVGKTDRKELLAPLGACGPDDFIRSWVIWDPRCFDLEQDSVVASLEVQLCGDRALHVICTVAANDVFFFIILVETKLQIELILPFEALV